MPHQNTADLFRGVSAQAIIATPEQPVKDVANTKELFSGVRGSDSMPVNTLFKGVTAQASFTKEADAKMMFPGINSMPLNQNLAIPSGAEKPVKSKQDENNK